MTKSSFWSKFKKKAGFKKDYDEPTKSSQTSSNSNTALTLTQHYKYGGRGFKSNWSDKSACCNTCLDSKVTLDINCVEKMVCKVKELQKRMQLFETYYMQNIATEPVQIGDYIADKPSKLKKDNVMNRVIGGFNPTNYKVPGTLAANGRSIYTSNIREPSITKNEKNKSNASIVMSMFSTPKPELVEVRSSAKNFQIAAEEFIEQAEQLKSKIGYILKCTGHETASSSERSVQSISNGNSDSSLDDSTIKCIMNTLSGQYKQIINILTAVDKRLSDLTGTATYGNSQNYLINQNPSNGFVDRTRNPQNLSFSSSNGALRPPESNQYLSTNNGRSSMIRNFARESDGLDLSSKVASTRSLEPIVMVYDPIEPKRNSGTSCKYCKHCGKQYTPCVEFCKDATPGKRASKSKNKQ